MKREAIEKAYIKVIPESIKDSDIGTLQSRHPHILLWYVMQSFA